MKCNHQLNKRALFVFVLHVYIYIYISVCVCLCVYHQRYCWFGLNIWIYYDDVLTWSASCERIYRLCWTLIISLLLAWIKYQTNTVATEWWLNAFYVMGTERRLFAVTSHMRRGVSKYQQLVRLFNSQLRWTPKETSKLRITAIWSGMHQWPVDSPHKDQ